MPILAHLYPLDFLPRLQHPQLLLHLHYNLLHLQIGPLSVLRIHIQFLHQRHQPILQLHPPDLLNDPLDFLKNHLPVGLIAQQFHPPQGCAVGLLHLVFVMIDLFIGLFQLFLQGFQGVGGLRGTEELGFVEVFVFLAGLLDGLVLLLEGQEGFAQLGDLGGSCLDGLSQQLGLLIVSFLQHSVELLFLSCQCLAFFLKGVSFFLDFRQFLVRLINDHSQVLILFPFSGQLLFKSCVVPLLLLDTLRHLFLAFLHHQFVISSLSFQLIGDGNQSLVVTLIRVADFQQVLLQSMQFSLQGCLFRCQFLLDFLQCPIFLDQPIDIFSAVYRSSPIQPLHSQLITLPNLHHLLPYQHILLPQKCDFLPQLLLTLSLQLLKAHAVLRIIITRLVVWVIYLGFAGCHGFCFRVFLEVQEVIGVVLIWMRWWKRRLAEGLMPALWF